MVAEQATERMVVSASPEQCFEVSDIERYPQWAADIKQVAIERRDDEGRPARRPSAPAAFGRSTSYTLAYDYTEAPCPGLEQTAGDLTSKLDGSYLFEPVGRWRHRGHLQPRGRVAGPVARGSSSAGPRAASCTPPSRSSRPAVESLLTT